MSCNNELDLLDESEDSAIVYGLVNLSDTASYIRIEKSFKDPKISPEELAKNPEKLYFNNIKVSLVNTKSGKSFDLVRVDGNKEGYVRNEGAFAKTPNYLYKIKRELWQPIARDTYLLVIKTSDDKILTQGKTRLISALQDDDITSPNRTGLLSILPQNNIRFRWLTDDHALNHSAFLNIVVKEDKGGVTKDTTMVWHIAENSINSDITVSGRLFYEAVAGSLSIDPLIKRSIKSVSLTVFSSDRDWAKFVTVGQANLSLTSSGEIPIFSNLSQNAVGIFASAASFTRHNIQFARPTLDSLRSGSITKSLNFQ